MMGRTLAAVSSITRPISSLAQLEANLNAAGALEILVRQARTTASATTLQSQP
jgi:glycine cleavage system regulatory protein